MAAWSQNGFRRRRGRHGPAIPSSTGAELNCFRFLRSNARGHVMKECRRVSIKKGDREVVTVRPAKLKQRYLASSVDLQTTSNSRTLKTMEFFGIDNGLLEPRRQLNSKAPAAGEVQKVSNSEVRSPDNR